ncbi:MAG: VOC family protein [Vicinamibacteraceae bacterium]
MPTPTRRDFLQRLTAATLAGVPGEVRLCAGQEARVLARDAVDHLLLGVADRELGIAWVEQRTGVKAVIGGSHPGVGTCNALLSLGERQYLEIIAPDPEQVELAPRYQLLTTLKTPRLITWAAAMRDAEVTAKRLRAAGIEVGGVNPGSRQRPDGKLLRWVTVGVSSELGSIIPFFIEWDAATTHPAVDSPPGCRLQAIAFMHPDPDRARETLLRLGIEATVKRGTEASLTAVLDTPKGRVELA